MFRGGDPFKTWYRGRLVVVAGGFALGVEQAGPVLRFEPLLKVAVDEDLDILAL